MGEPRSACQFGPFELQVDRRLLLRDGVAVPLAPKALETLIVLDEHRDRVLSKDELLQRIWGDTVVEEGGLTRNISVLRKALGESPDDHRYIVTVPGRGYRFVADARPAPPEPGAEPGAESGAEPGAEPAAAGWPWRRALLGAGALLAAAALIYVWRSPRAVATGRPQITALAVLPLNNLSGDPSQE